MRRAHRSRASPQVPCNAARPIEGESLIRHTTFEVQKWLLGSEREITEPGRFAIGVCLTGELSCGGRNFKPGEFFLVPAQLENRMLRPKGENVSLLRVTMPGA